MATGKGARRGWRRRLCWRRLYWRRLYWRRLGAGAAVLVLAATAAGCGGRVANPVSREGNFDIRLSCAHIRAERIANDRRIEDLRDERVDNRVRNLTKIPSVIFGNPFTALALVDTSRAIYVEIGAIEERNHRLDELGTEKNCAVEA